MVRAVWCAVLLGIAVVAGRGQPPGPLPEDSNWVALGFPVDDPFVAVRPSPQYFWVTGEMELVNGVRAAIVRVHRRTGQMEVVAREVQSIGYSYPDIMVPYGDDTLFIAGNVRAVFDAQRNPIGSRAPFSWYRGRWEPRMTGIWGGTVMQMELDGDTLYCAGVFQGVDGDTVLNAQLVKLHVPTGRWSVWGQRGQWGSRGSAWINSIAVGGGRWIAMMGGGLDTVDGVALPGNIALYDRLRGQWEAVLPGLQGIPVEGVFVGEELWVLYWGIRSGEVIGVYDLRQRRWVRTERLPGVQDGDSLRVQLRRGGGAVYVLYQVWRSGEYQGRSCIRWQGGRWEEIPLAAEMVPEDVWVNIVADEQGLYAAGSFSLGGLNGAPPQGIVCVAQYDAEQRQWRGVGVYAQGNPRAYPSYRTEVMSMVRCGKDTLVVGGRFRLAGGKPAANIAFLRTSTMEWFPVGQGGLPRWYPGVTGEVYALAVVGEELYVGGNFTRAGEQPIRNLACFDLRTGQWRTVGERSPDGLVTVLRRWGDSLWVGGGFYMVDTLFSPHLAIWDLRQRRWVRPEGIEVIPQPKEWGSPVIDIEMHDGKVYVLGLWYFKAFAEGNRGDTLRGFLRWDGRRWDFAVDPSRYRGGAVSLANWHIRELQPSYLGLLVAVGGIIYLADGRLEESGVYVLEADTLRPLLVNPVLSFRKLGVDDSTGEVFVNVVPDDGYYANQRASIGKLDLQGDSIAWLGSGIQGVALVTLWSTAWANVLLPERERLWVGGRMVNAGRRYSQGLAYWKRQPVGVELERSLVRTGRSYPVPAHEAVWVEYELELGGEAVLEVVDGLGRVVSYRVLGWRGAGRHRERVELAGMAAGVYRWCIRAGQEQRVGWMVLVR
jgi:hypothetical protein